MELFTLFLFDEDEVELYQEPLSISFYSEGSEGGWAARTPLPTRPAREVANRGRKWHDGVARNPARVRVGENCRKLQRKLDTFSCIFLIGVINCREWQGNGREISRCFPMMAENGKEKA